MQAPHGKAKINETVAVQSINARIMSLTLTIARKHRLQHKLLRFLQVFKTQAWNEQSKSSSKHLILKCDSESVTVYSGVPTSYSKKMVGRDTEVSQFVNPDFQAKRSTNKTFLACFQTL